MLQKNVDWDLDRNRVEWEEPEPVEIGVCAACEEPIYEGETIRRDHDGNLLHNDRACLEAWVAENHLIAVLCDAVGIEEEIAQ